MKTLIASLCIAACVVTAQAEPHGMNNEPAHQKRQEAQQLDQVDKVKTLLSDARVDQIGTIEEYRAYQKKLNKVLRFLLRDHFSDL